MSNDKPLPDIAPDLPREPDGASRAKNGRFSGPGKAGGRPAKGRREKHGLGGLRALTRAVLARDEPVQLEELDKRTRAGKLLAELRRDLLETIGEPDEITPQHRLLVDLLVTDYMVTSSYDAHLVKMALADQLVDTDKAGRVSVAPIVRERAYLADSMSRRLQLLGLELRPRRTKSLTDHLAERYGVTSGEPDGETGPRGR